jgi:excisionase family DNA binding protein
MDTDIALMTVPEAAEAMALKSSTIRKWILERRIPYVRLGKRAIRIPRTWIEEQIHEGWHEAVRQVAL